MVVKGDADEADDKKWWGVHAQRSRLIIFSPEPQFFIYLVSTLIALRTGTLTDEARMLN
jgi:hypothetical protein